MTKPNSFIARTLRIHVAVLLALAVAVGAPRAHAEELRDYSRTSLQASADLTSLQLQADPCDDVWTFLRADNSYLPGLPKLAQVAIVGHSLSSGISHQLVVGTDIFGRYQLLGDFFPPGGYSTGELDVRFARKLNTKAMRYDYTVWVEACRGQSDCNYPLTFAATPTECTATDSAATVLLRRDGSEKTVVIRFSDASIGG